MHTLKEKLLTRMLKSYGFRENEFKVHENDGVVFNNIDLQVVTEDLQKEGAPIQNALGRNDNNYHNYIYPSGLFPGYEQMSVTLHQENVNKGRIDTIKLPLSSLMRDIKQDTTPFMLEWIGTINLINETEHTFVITQEQPQAVIFTAKYTYEGRNIGKGGTPGVKLLDAIISQMMPRIPHKDDIGGPNTISDLGRIAPIIAELGKAQLKSRLLNRNPGGGQKICDVLTLKDQFIARSQKNSSKLNPLNISAQDMQTKFDKECREEQFLVRILEGVLGVKDNTSWISVDNDFFERLQYASGDNKNKFTKALDQQNPEDPAPLYITTTTGAHAFGIKVDFKTKTLFVANAAGDISSLEHTINLVKRATECNKVVEVVTQPLARDYGNNPPTQDMCTADAIVMTQMLINNTQPLSTGCLNNVCLDTERNLSRGINTPDRDVKRNYPVEGGGGGAIKSTTVSTADLVGNGTDIVSEPQKKIIGALINSYKSDRYLTHSADKLQKLEYLNTLLQHPDTTNQSIREAVTNIRSALREHRNPIIKFAQYFFTTPKTRSEEILDKIANELGETSRNKINK